MKRSWTTTSALFLAMVAFFTIGCGGDNGGHMTRSGDHTAISEAGPDVSAVSSSLASVTIWPTDQMTGVRTDGAVQLNFSEAMNTGSVMAGFHLVQGDESQAWMDFLASLNDHSGDHGGMGGHGGMGCQDNMMDMDDMMAWMSSMDVPGEFQWNETMDNCVFVPDNTMTPNCDYMVLLDMGEMMNSEGHMMDITDHDHGLSMSHFTTGSTKPGLVGPMSGDTR